jgi:replicative DNA helicase
MSPHETPADSQDRQSRAESAYLEALRTRLERLHVHNGEPSVRVIASRTGRAISHTTVHAVLRCKKLPAWGQLELVVENLGGDVDEFRQDWIKARDAERGLHPQSTDEAEAEDALADTQDGQESRTVVFADMLKPLIDDMDSIGAGRPAGVATGFFDLDRLLNGLHPGQLVVIAGRPGMGKTMLGLTMARQAAIRQGLASLYMSFRTPRLEITRRVVAAEARIPTHTLSAAQLSDDQWTQLARRLGEVGEAPLFINDDHSPTLDGVTAEARRLSEAHGFKVIFVDGVQKLSKSSQGSTEISPEVEVSRHLKRLAFELDIPIVAVYDLPAKDEHLKETADPPQLDALRGIDEDADVVIFLHRDDYFDVLAPRAGEADLIVARNRSGPTGTVTVAAQLHLSRFVDMAV